MTGLRITKTDVDWAVAQGLLREDQAAPLWTAWTERRAAALDVAPRFSITHVLYYLGGIIAIGAMTLLMNLGWERFGPWALFGTLAFWSGLTMQQSDSEFGKFVYLLINVALLAAGAVLGRRVFAVLGGLGIAAAYLGHLVRKVFADSLLFPFALTLIGLAIVAAGIWWQRNEVRLSAALRARLPAGWRETLQTRHTSLGNG